LLRLKGNEPIGRASLSRVIVTDIDDDAVQPRLELSIRPETLEVLINSEKDLLSSISRVFAVPEHAPGYCNHSALVAVYYLLECRVVTGLCAVDDRRERRPRPRRAIASTKAVGHQRYFSNLTGHLVSSSLPCLLLPDTEPKR